MKALKTKVILSAFVLLFAVVATIGSTFAWFTVSSQVSVDQFQLEVQTVDSLLIRIWDGENLADDADLLDAQTYSTNLTPGAIALSSQYATFPAYKLTPVTAAQQGGSYPFLTYTTLNPFELSILNIESAVRAPLVTPALKNDAINGNFIELKFWLMSQGTGTKEVVLQNLNLNLTGITQLTAQEIVLSAVRLGIGSTSGATDATENQNPTSGYVFARRVASPVTLPYGFEFTSGMKGYHDPMLPAFGADYTDPLNPVPGTVFNQIDSDEQNDLYDLHKLFYVSASPVAGQSTSTWNDANLQTIVSLTQNTPQLVTVRIYIEGWDETANNAIIAAKFNISFQFAFRQ